MKRRSIEMSVEDVGTPFSKTKTTSVSEFTVHEVDRAVRTIASHVSEGRFVPVTVSSDTLVKAMDVTVLCSVELSNVVNWQSAVLEAAHAWTVPETTSLTLSSTAANS